jgi:indolepyruvate ferredoxin oxidoreductase alpha subunit
VFAVIGDSTFLHSGMTGLLEAVYNRANVTIIILDNHITAMTGGQMHPAAGMTLQGQPTKSVDFVALAKVLGADHVETIDPYEFNQTWEILKATVARPGVNVLVTTRPCMLFPRKIKQEPYTIVGVDCNGCGVCLKIGCPAIARSGEVTAKGLAIPVIDPAACTGCRLCADLCPQDCIVLESELRREQEVKA